jgi:hypothetical protein
VIVGEFNNPLSPIDGSSKQTVNTEILELNETIDQMDLTDVYRIFHLAAAQLHSSQQPMELSPKQTIS